MKTLQRVLGRVTVAVVALWLASAPANAGADWLAVVDDSGQVAAGVLRLGGDDGCCAGGACTGAFTVRNVGDDSIRGVTTTVSDLRAADGSLAGSAVALSPASIAKLGPGQEVRFEVSVTVAVGVPGGVFRGTVGLVDATGRARADLPVELTLCAPPAPGLRITTPEGRAISFAPGAGGCAGEAFSATVEIENTGDVSLGYVVLLATGQGPDVSLDIRPHALSLEPGEKASFSLRTLGLGGPRPHAHTLALEARDTATGARDSRDARIERCALPDVIEPDPIDDEPPGWAALVIEQVVSRPSARVGQVVTLRVTVRNVGDGVARDVVIEDQLPIGLAYVAGRSAVDGAAWYDPRATYPHRWELGDLDAGDSRTLAFQVVVSTSAERGRATARAWARSASGEAGPAEVALEVGRDALRLRGRVRGQVRYADGAVAAAVRVLLDSDREARTDERGRFLFEGVRGGDHQVSIDSRSLGRGERPLTREARLIYLFDGATESVEFTVAGSPELRLSVERVSLEPASPGRER